MDFWFLMSVHLALQSNPRTYEKSGVPAGDIHRDVCARYKEVPRSTAFRTLQQLEHEGLLLNISRDRYKRYVLTSAGCRQAASWITNMTASFPAG